MPRILEKVERRLGEKLFLKGERCSGPKCAMVRRAYPPGQHGKGKGKGGRGRKRTLSDFAVLMREKQKVRYLYGLDDREIERYSKEAAIKQGIFSINFLQGLESRLDNVVYRLGFAESRRIARQMVGHGHIMVNQKRVNIPSYRVKKDEVVSINQLSLSKGLFQNLEIRLKKYEGSRWLQLDKEKKSGKVLHLPQEEDAGLTADLTKIKEFYSK